MNIIRFIFFLCLLNFTLNAQSTDIKELDQLIDNWHKAAAEADFESYFSITTRDFIFLGTDPSERWTKKQFMFFCKPYFDKGKAWSFKSLSRAISTQSHVGVAELADAQG